MSCVLWLWLDVARVTYADGLARPPPPPPGAVTQIQRGRKGPNKMQPMSPNATPLGGYIQALSGVPKSRYGVTTK